MTFPCFQYFHVPLNGLHPNRPGGIDHMVVIFPVRTAKQRGAHSGHRLNFVVAGVEVGNDLIGGQAVEMGVVGRMVHDLMSCVMERFYRLRVFVHPLPYHEKGGLYIVFSQNLNKLLGVLVAPG